MGGRRGPVPCLEVFLPNSFMRTILTLGVALGVPALGSVATAQQTHEYFLWGGTPATTTSSR